MAPMRIGFFGTRGINEILDENGNGIYAVVEREGREHDRFFYNVGQPDQTPPCHQDHRDDPAYSDSILLEACSFGPFYAKVRFFSNELELRDEGDAIAARATLVDPVRFAPVGGVQRIANLTYRIGSRFHVAGLDLDRVLQPGIVDFVVTDAADSPALAPGLVRQTALRPAEDILTPTARNIARASVFFSLHASPLLSTRLSVAVNRVWIRFLARLFSFDDAVDGPLLFGWDTAFSSIILADFDPDLALTNLLSLLQGMDEDGRIPQLVIGPHRSNRTSPPVWFIAAEKVARATGETDVVRRLYDPLLANYRWFKSHRMNPDSTFSWGCDDQGGPRHFGLSGKVGAVYESGLDDSPLFDEMDLVSGKLDHACIDLSALMYRANETLLWFAHELGNDQPELERDRVAFGDAIRLFFDLEAGTANSFRWEGGRRRYVSEITPASFYPLLTSSAGPQEANILERLFHSGHFQGRYGLPSLSRLSKAHDGDGDYWRGRIWPPMVYLTALGFERHLPEVASEIREMAHGLLVREWLRHNHIHENYSSLTGEGEPRAGTYARSCPFYSWGGLLGVV